MKPRKSGEVTAQRFGPALPTTEEAREAGRNGWNLRCNRCGGYGAQWIPGARRGWGALALCHPEAEEYFQMMRRHDNELSFYTTVNFEQDARR